VSAEGADRASLHFPLRAGRGPGTCGAVVALGGLPIGSRGRVSAESADRASSHFPLRAGRGPGTCGAVVGLGGSRFSGLGMCFVLAPRSAHGGSASAGKLRRIAVTMTCAFALIAAARTCRSSGSGSFRESMRTSWSVISRHEPRAPSTSSVERRIVEIGRSPGRGIQHVVKNLVAPFQLRDPVG